ncbi:MAG: hypothetical protein JXB07_02525 [Anaerolineae bacterium]|nr:hypothetical protein [Anaerolineae bacterium]
MARKTYQMVFGVAVLLSVLGCRPAVTVGCQEMVVLFVIVVVLLGPLLFRMYQLWLRASDKQDEHRDG